MSDPSYLPENNMWVRLDVDPDNLDPEYRPSITKSDNWPGDPFSVMTIGWDNEAGVAISTLSCARDINSLMLMIALLEITEFHANHSAGFPEDSVVSRALAAAREYLEGVYDNEEDDE